jgi:hypothetical protein
MFYKKMWLETGNPTAELLSKSGGTLTGELPGLTSGANIRAGCILTHISQLTMVKHP